MADEKDEVIVDLDPKDDKKDGKLDIEIEDDTPEQDRGRQPRKPGTESAMPKDEDEIGQYTKGVQDRLRKMSWEFHEERRAKESLQRENERAIEFAKRVLEQNKRYQEIIEQGHKSLRETSEKAAESEISTVRSALAQAIAAGDHEKIAEFNEKMSRATARAEAALHIPPVQFEELPEPPRIQPRVQLSEVTRQWMDRNPWFHSDDRMKAIAMMAHERLIRSGVQAESQAYFDGIDKEVREVFPDKFEKESGRSPNAHRSTVVAPARRSPATADGKVKLTLSEARVAEKLGVPLAEYAKQKLLRMQQEQQ